MHSLNLSSSSQTHAAAGRSGGLPTVRHGAEGVGRTAEGRQASGEAAGLVQFKTSPNQNLQITFSASETALRRVKRQKKNTFLAGAFLSLPRPGYRPDQAWFVTLTYDTKGTLGRGAHTWLPDHIARATDAYRRWCKSNKLECKYTWVAELQSNGNVHYHGAFWLPQGVKMPKWDVPNGKRKAFWNYGMSNTQKLQTNVGYLMKYLSKMGELTRFPHGLRLSGCGGMCQSGKQVRSWHSLPEWVKRTHGCGEVKRIVRGYVNTETGEILPPMYRRRFVEGGIELELLREFPDRFHDGPYCTLPSFSG